MIGIGKQHLLDPALSSGGFQPLARRLRRLSLRERRAEAAAFLDLFYEENVDDSADRQRRKAEVDRDLKQHGMYTHTPQELAFGAKVAWRNHARCIGRLYWRSLVVRDCRNISDPDGIADEVIQHMHAAFNRGKIKSVITIFAPVTPQALPAHIGANQVTRYAGYLQRDGSVVGDRANVEATRQAQAAGWKGDGGQFDILPMPVISADGRRVFKTLPDSTTYRVPLIHADYPAFASLGLEWYAVPCITDMILTIGGIDYPCAPFNGFYMGTEIASRNLVDPWRFDLLGDAARSFGINPEGRDPLWRDRALTELNAAVLQSYQKAGVTLVDHHTAARDFMKFRADESASGRALHADWSWIVPPQASSVLPPFHIEMQDHGAVPNYYHSWIADGWKMMPFDGNVSRSRLAGHIRDARRWLHRKLRKPGTFRR
ncbi:nitric oxide synthase oxygenase [Ketobacter sp.]|uniref:nitric oxide synthase oxygenase n=1 Tax=Ketobacter sp. TaxID=2083498 RepID=UPI000F295341|nr:nitric oxide synthase oxygenase [Ketobacter sp.]RLU01214.1 MAG: nitric oxide synthase oxygenase [Ketobacter sp.]